MRLRPLAAADGPRLLAWRNSEAVSRWMYTDHLISEPEHARWLAAALTAEDRRDWIVEVDGEPVGVAGLGRIDPRHGRCELGHYLAEPSVRGRGVGAAVEYALAEQAFGPLGLNKLWCEVLIDNEGAWRLHESFGFRREALFREHVVKGGRRVDVVGLGLLAADWAGLREGYEARLRARGRAPARVWEGALSSEAASD